MRPIVPFIIALALVVGACGSDAAGEGPLIVYSGRTEDLVGPLFAAFEAETGIELEVRYADSTELAATLILEGERSDADVFFAQDPASLGAVANAGLLAELPADLVDRVPARFSDTAGRWVGTSGRARTVVYNPDLVADGDLPESIWDLTDPRFAGLGVAPTNGSFLAFVAAMIVDEGEDRTLEWLQAIAANAPISYPRNSPIVEAVDTGEIALGLVNHYYLLRLEAEQGSVVAANHFLGAGDAGSLVMPAGAGIMTGSDQRGQAIELIEFLLSNEAQQHFATETFEYPLIPGIAADPRLVPIDELSTPDIDLSRLADFLDKATELVTRAGLI